MTSRIKLIAHPYAWETMQARMDHAEVTGQPLVERPYWYEDIESGDLFYDLFGCIAWPTEVSDKSEPELPGYAAIIGVVRPSDSMEHLSPDKAVFKMLAESESGDVKTLMEQCRDLRVLWGYGQRRELLQEFHGDPNRFIDTIAIFNEQSQDELLITPPDAWDVPMIFDHYARSLRSAILQRRIHPGKCPLFLARLKEFRRNDPIIMAVGGMVHTLLGRCLWMDQATTSAWRMEDKAIA